MDRRIVHATFENIDFAEDAIRNIKNKVLLSGHSISLLKQNHTQKPKIILPIRPLSNSDRAEQTHGNLLPIIESGDTQPSGECVLKLSVSPEDSKTVAGNLYNLHGYHVNIF